MARTTAFSRQVQLFGDQVGEMRRQALIGLAKESFDAASAQNVAILGHQPLSQTIVDGRTGAAESSVKEGGTIVYLFQVGSASLKMAVDEAFNVLAELSPVKSGRYQNSFLLFVNGTQRDADIDGLPIDLLETDEVEIVNMAPYSRKIERGWSRMAPNGVIEVATTSIRARYGNLLQIGFTYRGFIGAASGAGQLVNPMNDPTRRAASPSRGRKGRFTGSTSVAGPKAYNLSAKRWPTMTLRVK